MSVLILFLIFAAIIGIVLYNYGDELNIKNSGLLGFLIIVISCGLIYFSGFPRLEYYKRENFVKEEFGGLVSNKYIDMEMDGRPQIIEIVNGNKISKLVFYRNEIFDKTEIGDTLKKVKDLNLFLLKNNERIDSFERNFDIPFTKIEKNK